MTALCALPSFTVRRSGKGVALASGGEFAHFDENRLIRPSRLTDQMQKRLMLGRNPSRRNDRRHRLHALAFTGHQQANAIILERSRPVPAPHNCRQGIDIISKTRFTRLRQRLHCPRHSPFSRSRNQQNSKSKGATNLRKRDSVELVRQWPLKCEDVGSVRFKPPVDFGRRYQNDRFSGRRLRETLTGTERAPSGRANTNGNADARSGHASSVANLLGRCRY